MPNFYIIGNPVSQSKSPLLFKYIFKKIGLRAKYKAQIIDNINDLSIFIKKYKELNIHGLNITMPLKEIVYPYIDSVDKNAKIIKSINCIHFKNNKILGYNNDYYGFNKLLEKYSIQISNSNNIILGSGGAAKAIILSLIHHQAKNIYLLSRNKKQSSQLIESIKPHLGLSQLHILTNNVNLNNCNLINCTPIGMLETTDITLIRQIPQIHYKAIIDINYTIKHHYFNQNADIKIDGKTMFIFQALKSLDIWFESNISDKLSYQELERIIC